MERPAKTLADDSTVKVAQDRTIDPALLFQQFLIMSKTGQFSLEDVMSYELCSFPAALFEGKDIFRKANKPKLAQAVSEFFSVSTQIGRASCRERVSSPV